MGLIKKLSAAVVSIANEGSKVAAASGCDAEARRKGFAVITDEVRTLAETSKKSARRVQHLVRQVQQEVNVIAGRHGQLRPITITSLLCHFHQIKMQLKSLYWREPHRMTGKKSCNFIGKAAVPEGIRRPFC